MVNKNLFQSAIFGFNWMIISKATQFILQFLLLMVLARLLTANEFGLMGLALSIITITQVLSTMGIGPAIVRRKTIDDEFLQSAFFLSIVLNFFFAVLIYLLASTISVFFNMSHLEEILKALTSIFIIKSFGIVATFLLQRNMSFKILAFQNVFSYLGYALIGIIFAFAGYGVWSLVFAQIAQAIIFTLIAISVQKHKKTIYINKKLLKELFYFGGGFSLAKIFNQIALQGDNLVIGRSLGSDALGVYSRAYQIMVMPTNLFGEVIDKVLFPVLSKIQDENDKLRYWFVNSQALLILILSPIVAIFTIYTEAIVMVILGADWLDAVPPLQILTLGLFFRTLYKISDSMVRAKGAVYKRANIQLVYAIFVFAGAIIGQFWGLVGVSVGVTVAITINYILMMSLSLSLISTSWSEVFRSLLKPSLFLLANIIILSVSYSWLVKFPSILSIIFAGLVQIIMGIVIFRFYPSLFMSKESEYIAIKIKSKIFKR
ncbi:lipopolysaccharide biosynthesis protein [Salisediminibacterium halotolerans]|uniref:lipopolysaccharide biosynthesis protein n=1 Tax=Salisediminibacterium halotolerans TaxID=517425 RepID=UPI00115FFE54|nr:lipopolysaccharide biosynthesis protein [Salisediminibacterium haloalkalitolerans]